MNTKMTQAMMNDVNYHLSAKIRLMMQVIVSQAASIFNNNLC